MPLITVKVFEDELTQQQIADIIQRITEAVIPFVGERLREATWVLVEEIKSGAWGIGGKPFGLPELRAIQAGQSPEDKERDRHRRETT